MQTNPDEENTIFLDKKVGTGAEIDCYTINQGESIPQKVLKTPHLFGRFWQTQTKEHIERCLNAIREIGISSIPTRIREKIQVVFPCGTIKLVKLATEHPYIADIDEKVLQYEDLIDPEVGPKIVAELLE